MKCPWCRDKPITLKTVLGLKEHVKHSHPYVSEKTVKLACKLLEKERKGDFKLFERISKRYPL